MVVRHRSSQVWFSSGVKFVLSARDWSCGSLLPNQFHCLCCGYAREEGVTSKETTFSSESSLRFLILLVKSVDVRVVVGVAHQWIQNDQKVFGTIVGG